MSTDILIGLFLEKLLNFCLCANTPGTFENVVLTMIAWALFFFQLLKFHIEEEINYSSSCSNFLNGGC